MPRVSLMFLTASMIIDRVFKPRKSILISPVSSITRPSYWVTSSFPSSLSTAVLTGTQSEILSRHMITPQACTPVPRTLPSSFSAYFSVSRISGFGFCCSALNSGTSFRQLVRFILASLPFTSGICLGSSFTSLSLSGIGSPSTRATSFKAILVAIVP